MEIGRLLLESHLQTARNVWTADVQRYARSRRVLVSVLQLCCHMTEVMWHRWAAGRFRRLVPIRLSKIWRRGINTKGVNTPFLTLYITSNHYFTQLAFHEILTAASRTAPCETLVKTPLLSQRSKNASGEIDAKPTFQLPTIYSASTY
jgi:hypothetical protein